MDSYQIKWSLRESEQKNDQLREIKNYLIAFSGEFNFIL